MSTEQVWETRSFFLPSALCQHCQHLSFCPEDNVIANIDLIKMHRNLSLYTEAMQTKQNPKRESNSLSCFASSTGISFPNEDILFLFREIKILKIRKFPLRFTIQELSSFVFLFSHFPIYHLTCIHSPVFYCQEHVEYI